MKLKKKLYYRHTDLFTRQLDLVFFDTTSTYVEGGAGAFDLLDYGHSKDHRPDRLQVMIGVLMSRDGIPLLLIMFFPAIHPIRKLSWKLLET